MAGVLVSLHRRPSKRGGAARFVNETDLNTVGGSNGNNGLFAGNGFCDSGLIHEDHLQQVVAAKWAVDVINAQSGPKDLKIGKQFFTGISFMEVTIYLNNMITEV